MIDAGAEIGRLASSHIIDEAVFTIDTRIIGPAPEGFAAKLVLDFGRSETGFERFPIELRKTEAARAAANVAHDVDLMPKENAEESAELKIGMADGEELAGSGGRWRHGRVSQGQGIFCRNAVEGASDGAAKRGRFRRRGPAFLVRLLRGLALR